ncbi:ferredoxin--NADP reductase, root isozyme, chloroplastic-like isoform X2 [Lotus japonicus]|nr:ferredoxin--NADP reductase, root isozyme, chloroplastic-like isoform X2 [Lotus japonicus]
MAVTVPVGSDLSIRRSGFKASNFNFWDNSWAPVFTLDLKANSSCVRSRQVICMSVPVQQASVPKVIVSPLELEAASEPPLNLHKPKQPYTTIVSVERIVGPKAPGETCHIVIDHGGNVPYWEGQSYGFIPPVSDLLLILILCFRSSLYLISGRESIMIDLRLQNLLSVNFDERTPFWISYNIQPNVLRVRSLILLVIGRTLPGSALPSHSI